jgi:hypothetical protein
MSDLIVYGDFACPLSRMASRFVDALLERGRSVRWRAVHADGRHARGSRIIGMTSVRPGILEPHPCSPIRAELVSPHCPELFDPSLAIAALADVDGEEAHALRAALFRAHWRDHRDLGDRRVVEAIAGRAVASPVERADRWQRTWEGFAAPATPLVLLPTGYVFREADALDELARRYDVAKCLATSSRRAMGGRS